MMTVYPYILCTIFIIKNNEDVSSGSEYDPEKWRVCCNKKLFLDLLLNKPKSF